MNGAKLIVERRRHRFRRCDCDALPYPHCIHLGPDNRFCCKPRDHKYHHPARNRRTDRLQRAEKGKGAE